MSITRIFADDTSLSSSSKDTEEIKRNLENDLDKIHDWSIKWKIDFNPNKTELLFIGNCPDNFEVNFNNISIKPVNSHKHLGITFDSNAKWSSHIDNICKSALARINFLKKFKFTFSRKTLNKIYCSFILPILEYGCEVWGGCNKGEEEKLEKVQLEAARLVTGLPLFASKESLYFETGWEKLKDRRERRKLCTLHKIYHNAAPDYLTEILESYSITNPYNLRRVADFNIPRYRLNTTINSFYPSTVHSWNNTNPDIRHNPSLNHFKSYLKSQNHDVIIPRYLLYGERKLNVLQTRIRCISSNLNSDLFRVNLTNSPLCQCGNYLEDSYHFFLECRMYHPQRLKLFQTLSNYHPIDADLSSVR